MYFNQVLLIFLNVFVSFALIFFYESNFVEAQSNAVALAASVILARRVFSQLVVLSCATFLFSASAVAFAALPSSTRPVLSFLMKLRAALLVHFDPGS